MSNNVTPAVLEQVWEFHRCAAVNGVGRTLEDLDRQRIRRPWRRALWCMGQEIRVLRRSLRHTRFNPPLRDFVHMLEHSHVLAAAEGEYVRNCTVTGRPASHALALTLPPLDPQTPAESAPRVEVVYVCAPLATLAVALHIARSLHVRLVLISAHQHTNSDVMACRTRALLVAAWRSICILRFISGLIKQQ